MDGHLNLQSTDFGKGAFVLINKPLDWTSFDVVAKLRNALRKKYGKIKVGHAGTLDPKATGLLIIATGSFTKRIEEIQGLTKTYTGHIVLGTATESYDVEGAITKKQDIPLFTDDELAKAKNYFIGKQMQLPPMFSARKVNGKALYKYAREGKQVERRPKEIEVFKFDITKVASPNIHFNIECSNGTYIRTIANDFGLQLNNCSHLGSLQRVAIGHYSLDNAYDILELTKTLSQQWENESI